jgi:membrane-associated phospholipid phosphatase
MLAWIVVIYTSPRARRLTERFDAFVLVEIARARTAWLTDVASTIDRFWSEWPVYLAAIAVLALLIGYRRWRHLITFLGSIFVYAIVSNFIDATLTRPRPYDVTTIGNWAGFSLPSLPVGAATLLVIGVIYSMVVPGRSRDIAKYLSLVLVALLAASRLYLAVDHPLDQVLAAVLAAAVAVNAFRFFTPNEVFPVAYGSGKTAHLDVTGRRGEAIRHAVRDQLGVTVIDIEPVGLAGSGGSTPLRLRVAGDPDIDLFGKLYAMNHVRADRWYKFGRTILYGRLEDEKPFESVRRLVQFEDYALRLMRDSNIPTATPFGIVELTPEREYMLVTEFIDGAREIGDAEVDDGVIDEGLTVIRRLWDSGLAHRDIKPANLMVQDGHVVLIDVAFAQVRPSPWRQAVDLANMMLVLAVRSDAERVYARALQFFSPDEIAEAFAATRGVASPTQLRTVLKQDGRDLVGEFRALAPAHPPISLQRWGVRRVVYALGLLFGVLLAVATMLTVVRPSETDILASPTCGTSDLMVLMAQAVPDSVAVPCIASLPTGWELGYVAVHQDEAMFWLDSDRAGPRSVGVRLRPPGACVVDDATSVPTDEPGARRFEEPERLPPDLRSVRYYLVDGGCITYDFVFSGGVSASLMVDVDNALSFQSRESLVDRVETRTGLRLCGAGVPCPGGS